MKRSYNLAYVVSFLLCGLGFILGLVLYLRDDEEARGAGVTCILLAVVSAGLQTIAYLNWNTISRAFGLTV